MEYGQIESAYRRMFGLQWDRMTEEEKRKIMSDPKLSGQISGKLMAEKGKRETDYQKASESAMRSRPGMMPRTGGY